MPGVTGGYTATARQRCRGQVDAGCSNLTDAMRTRSLITTGHRHKRWMATSSHGTYMLQRVLPDRGSKSGLVQNLYENLFKARF